MAVHWVFGSAKPELKQDNIGTITRIGFHMPSVNKVILIGNLGQKPELKYTQSQKAVTSLNVATQEFTSANGQKVEKTEWHKVQVWEKMAENCVKYLDKGSAVYVEGRLQTREWTTPTGEKRYATEIVASTVQFLSTAKPATQAAPAVSATGGFGMNMDEVPF